MKILKEIGKRYRYHTNLARKHGRITSDVALLTSVFFDGQGKSVIPGGAERYAIDLLNLIKDNYGFSTTIFQRSSNNELWHRKYDSIDVYGLPVRGKTRYLNYFFHHFVDCNRLTIYNTLDLATPLYNKPSIGISHGVYWDNPHRTRASKLAMVDSFFKGLLNVDKVVSVDTNTINFFRGVEDSRIVDAKCQYIPNFADETFFSNRRETRKDRIVVTYPRRVYEPRGYDIFEQVIRQTLTTNERVEFHIVGEIHDQAHATKVESLLREYPGKVFASVAAFSEMNKVYADSDIIIVPTKYSEGTSLSVIEAMASGCCVITTNVGGLPNLIIDEFNGFLCDPNAHDISLALERLLTNDTLRATISNNARTIAAQAFSKQLWNNKWLSVINEITRSTDTPTQ